MDGGLNETIVDNTASSAEYTAFLERMAEFSSWYVSGRVLKVVLGRNGDYVEKEHKLMAIYLSRASISSFSFSVGCTPLQRCNSR